MRIRMLGIVLLLVALAGLQRLVWLNVLVPAETPSPGELLLALLIVLAGMSGAALLCFGAALFGAYRWPPPDRD